MTTVLPAEQSHDTQTGSRLKNDPGVSGRLAIVWPSWRRACATGWSEPDSADARNGPTNVLGFIVERHDICDDQVWTRHNGGFVEHNVLCPGDL